MTTSNHSRSTANPTEDQHIYATWQSLGSKQRTADALGIPIFRVNKAINRAQGLCNCGRVPSPGYLSCDACRERARVTSDRRHAETAGRNVCRECGDPLAPKSCRFCERHLVMLREAQTNLRQRRRDAGVCGFCWEPRVPGGILCEKHTAYAAKMTVRARSKDKFGGLLEDVLERDDHRCQICLNDGPHIEVHHIDGRVNDMENLITLCIYCHKAITFLNYCRDADAVWDWFRQHPISHPDHR